MRLRLASLVVLVVVAGCGSEPVRAPYAGAGVSPGSRAVIADPRRDERIFLDRLYADPRLDPIRDKVPLQLRADAVEQGYLRIKRWPTAQEKQAIQAWLEVRERAQQYQLGVRGPPSDALAKTRARVTQAIRQLHAGKMTYAAFAMRMQEIDAQHQDTQRQTLTRQ